VLVVGVNLLFLRTGFGHMITYGGASHQPDRHFAGAWPRAATPPPPPPKPRQPFAMALTLVRGFVVDAAIVMLENIMRHVRRGRETYQAAMNGSREIAFKQFCHDSFADSGVFFPIPSLIHGRHVGSLCMNSRLTT